MLISCTPPRNSTATRIQSVVDAVSGADQGEHQHHDAGQAAERGAERAHVGGDVQRHVRERGERLEREPEQRRVRGAAAGRAPGAAVLDRHLLEAHPGDHAAQEAAPLGHACARCRSRAATSAGSRRPGPGRARAPASASSRRSRWPAARLTRLSSRPMRRANTTSASSSAARAEHVRDQLRRVLEVGVHQHDVVAAGVVEAGRHGHLHAEVARELDQRRRCPRARAHASTICAERSLEPSST